MSADSQNSLPLKTQHYIAAWILAAVSAFLILLLVESALNIPLLHATHEDFPRREYTFVSLRINKDPEDGRRTYLMTVEELEFYDEIECADLFQGNDPRERIMIFQLPSY